MATEEVTHAEQRPPTLGYATQPRHGNLIVTRTADGVSITVLPDRRTVRSALGRFILVLILTSAMFGTAWFVRADRLGFFVAAPIGLMLVAGMIVKFLATLRRRDMTADARGIRVAHGGAETEYGRAEVVDLVETRYLDGSGQQRGFWLQLRMKDGENVSLGRGTEQEVRELATLLREAMKIGSAEKASREP